MKRNRQKNALQKQARRILGSGSLVQLFERAAKRLNVDWIGTKGHGYELLRHLLTQKNGVHFAARKSRSSDQRRWNAVDVKSDAFLSSYEWRSLRMRVLIRCGARCQCCGQSAKDGIVIHVDHIKPRRLFPELALDESNLQVLCEVCNHGKGNWDQTNWSEEQLVDLPAEKVKPMWGKAVAS